MRPNLLPGIIENALSRTILLDAQHFKPFTDILRVARVDYIEGVRGTTKGVKHCEAHIKGFNIHYIYGSNEIEYRARARALTHIAPARKPRGLSCLRANLSSLLLYIWRSTMIYESVICVYYICSNLYMDVTTHVHICIYIIAITVCYIARSHVNGAAAFPLRAAPSRENEFIVNFMVWTRVATICAEISHM